MHYRKIAFSVVLFAVVSISFGCDSLQTTNDFRNEDETLKKVSEEYADLAGYAIQFAKKQRVPGSSVGTTDLLAKGVEKWSEQHGAKAAQLKNRFAEVEHVRARLQTKLRQLPRSKVESLSLGALLDLSGLDKRQINRILQLEKIASEAVSFKDLKSSLERFNSETRQRFGDADSAIILQLSALVKAQFQYLNTRDVSSLAEASTSKGFVLEKSGGDPPQWEHYYNAAEIAGDTLMGALGGAGLGAAVGGGIGAAAFGAGGALIGGVSTYATQVERYQNAVDQWCGQSGNQSHSDYSSTC